MDIDRTEAAVGACSAEKYRAENARDIANHHTLRTLREYPDFLRWYTEHGTPNEDPAHKKIVKNWLHGVSRYVDECGAYGRRDERIEKLLIWGFDFLNFEQFELLANTWKNVVDTEAYTSLPPAPRWLYRALHALAQERNNRGGQSVLLGNRQAITAIELLGGPWYSSLNTITQAREKLRAAGVVHVKVGQQHKKGKKSRATRYTLPLTDNPQQVNYPSRGEGDSSLAEGVPRFNAEQRAVMNKAFRLPPGEPNADLLVNPVPPPRRWYVVDTGNGFEVVAPDTRPVVGDLYVVDDEPLDWSMLVTELVALREKLRAEGVLEPAKVVPATVVAVEDDERLEVVGLDQADSEERVDGQWDYLALLS